MTFKYKIINEVDSNTVEEQMYHLSEHGYKIHTFSYEHGAYIVLLYLEETYNSVNNYCMKFTLSPPQKFKSAFLEY